MKPTGKLLALLGILIGVTAATAQAQSSDVAPQVYRMGDRSTYQHGCFPPCLCPIMEERPVRGTFVLTYTGSDQWYNYYDVSQVNWVVPMADGTELRIIGSGQYKIGGDFVLAHRLELDLIIDGGTVTHFDSFEIPGGEEFPNIFITVSINGIYCLDTVIVVDASPVPASEITPYRLVRGSTYQHGCWPPCLCPIFVEQPMVGTFALVFLGEIGWFQEYAVINVNWRVLSSTPSPGLPMPITGSGFYRVGGDFALTHQMTLYLYVNNGPQTRFDSGLIPGGGEFPFIDIFMSMNNYYCYDQVLHVRARPVKVTSNYMETVPSQHTN